MQLQVAFDNCSIPARDRVSLAGVMLLAEGCPLNVSSLAVVSTLCHSWLQRMRCGIEPSHSVEPVAHAVRELLPAPLCGNDPTWGVQPHHNSSSWMATWRVWRATAKALHMSGIICQAPPMNVRCSTAALDTHLFPMYMGSFHCESCRAARLAMCILQT
jgi:hypothetical protein